MCRFRNKTEALRITVNSMYKEALLGMFGLLVMTNNENAE